jgi:hypothetical protein
MAALEALERLQKFDWLIQKLHSLRTNLHSESGLQQELQKLHALQLLQQRGADHFPLNGASSSSIGESEEDKMELCKNGTEEEEEEIFNEELEEEEEEELEEEEEEEGVLDEEYEQENLAGEQLMPLALTTSSSVEGKTTSPVRTAPGTTLPPAYRAAAKDLSPPRLPPPPPADGLVRRNGFVGHQQPLRFPTGLFPPLPFEALFSDQELQVGEQIQGCRCNSHFNITVTSHLCCFSISDINSDQ